MNSSVDPTHETIVAVYATETHAEDAIRELRSSGIPDSAISRHAGTETVPGYGVPDHASEQPQGVGFWARLFGGQPPHDTGVYDRSLEGGSTVITVRAAAVHAAAIIDILERHEPVDIDEHAAATVAPATPGTAFPRRDDARRVEPANPAPGAHSETLALSAEELTVGKRLVDRGTTRIRRFVVETPVERQVSLHDERVVVDRRPVEAAAQAAAVDWSDRVIEMTETVEEPVVEKTARVVEEIGLRKEAIDRTETVRDTVRREDVEIEHVRGDTSAV